MFRRLLAGLVFLAACGTSGDTPPDPQPHPLTRNDVSVLYPLPAPGDDLLIRPATPGLGGPLLPREVFFKIGRHLTFGVGDGEAEYGALRLVALRFDPCFRVNLEDAACQPQVRAIWQAINVEDGVTHDGAVHTFYNLDAASWEALLGELENLTTLAPENGESAPLGVSPALAAQGLRGPYALGLLALVQAHCGAANLARMTFMTRTASLVGQWEFGGFHLIASPDTGFPEPGTITIFGSDALLQTVTQASGVPYRYVFDPESARSEGAMAHDAPALAQAADSVRQEVHAWAVVLEDPAQMVPDQVDCASCHVAGQVTSYLEGLDPALLTPALAAARAPRTITSAETDPTNLRAFGYFIGLPAVSQRAANESDAVAAALRR